MKGSKATPAERDRQRRAMEAAGFRVDDEGNLVGWPGDDEELIRRAKGGAIPADIAELLIWSGKRIL